MDKDQKINCSVDTCKYNDQADEVCTLDEIKVENVWEQGATDPDDSMCGSYENENENEE